MSEKNFAKSKMTTSETRKYLLFSSFYCTCGFLLLCWTFTYLGGMIYQIFPKLWGFESGRTPPYPCGLYILFLGVPLFTLVYWRLTIITLFKIRINSISRTFYVFLVFIMITGLSLFNFGFNIYFISYAIVSGGVLGLIDGIRGYKQDFSFLHHEHLSEAVKLAKLQMMHERWFRYIIFFITISFAITFGFGIQYILATPEPVRGENILIVTIIFAYLFVGIGLGILRDMFMKMNEVEGKILEL